MPGKIDKDYREVLCGNIRDVKSKIMNMRCPDYDEIIAAERAGENRKTLIDWLEKVKKNQIIIIEPLESSILVEEDLRAMEGKKERETPHKEPPLFYKRFVFRCKNCVEEFEHHANMHAREQNAVCPRCEKIHLVRITPFGARYEIEFPESIEVLKKGEEKK